MSGPVHQMTRIRQRSRFWSFMTMVVIAQLWVVMAMVSSGALHKRLHDHADEPGHDCGVTLMLSGGYDTVVPDIVPVDVESPPPLEPVTVLMAAVSVPTHLMGGVLAHAPPRGP